jgi:hypothetical protein
MKETNIVTNPYWIIGIAKSLATNKCAAIKIGHKMTRVKPVKGMLGAFPKVLYSDEWNWS